ncbi:PE-PGRS family protein [Mycobacterium tuberculosis]|nr:PE-PGRS family protein [Mycobacterium tuberculosis]
MTGGNGGIGGTGVLIGNGGNGGSGGIGAGKAGVGGVSGLLLGLDGFNAPASTSPLHTLQQNVLNVVNEPLPDAHRAPADRQRRQRDSWNRG